MGMLRIFCSNRVFLNEPFLNNIQTTFKLSKQLRYVSNENPVLEPDESFELGDFSSDVKKYVKKGKKSKNFLKYTEQEQHKDEIPIVICKNSKLNHYRNQTYDKFKPIPLASENWRSHRSSGDYFSIKVHTRDYEVKSRKIEVPFEQTELRQEIKDILKSKNIEFMSEIQQLALPALLSGRNNLLGAETGCGKTLAYLLPIIEQILQWKANTSKSLFNSPYVLILVPSRELADQIRDFCNWFKELGIKTRRIVGGNVNKKIHNPQFDEIDILVSTLGIVEKLTNADIYSLKNVRHAVLDEADCLLDDSFNELLLDVLKKMDLRSEPSLEKDMGTQLTLVSATMPTSLEEIFDGVIDVERLDTVSTEKLHQISPHITHKFIRTGKTSRPSYLLDITKKDYNKKSPSIIFCNHSETSFWVNSFLEDNGIPNVMLHGDMNLRDRKGKFDEFQKGDYNTLVCTSVASRGLDTHRVEHVVNFEFPTFIVDYVHRAGRTGRLSSKKPGTVTNLITGRNEVALVQKIEKSVRTMSSLENVNPNIKRIIKYYKASTVEKGLGLLH